MVATGDQRFACLRFRSAKASQALTESSNAYFSRCDRRTCEVHCGSFARGKPVPRGTTYELRLGTGRVGAMPQGDTESAIRALVTRVCHELLRRSNRFAPLCSSQSCWVQAQSRLALRSMLGDFIWMMTTMWASDRATWPLFGGCSMRHGHFAAM